MESNSNFNAAGNSKSVNSAPDRSTQDRAASAAHDVVDKVAGVADRATRGIKPTLDGVVDGAHKTVDKVSEVAGSATDWANEKTASVKEAGEKLMDDTCAYIGARPLKSLAIAIVAGVLIGKAVR
jgi:ElaB/YqjD/DUF883 family membrane-anchored ribosome-binding protein